MGFDTTPVGLKVIAAAIVSVGTAQSALCWKKREREREKTNSFLPLSPFIQKLVSQRLNRVEVLVLFRYIHTLLDKWCIFCTHKNAINFCKD